MNRYASSALALSTTLILGCGGKGAAARPPAAAVDPCTAGIQASGVTGRAATWDMVAEMADTTTDAVCGDDPCGPDEAYSYVNNGGLAVKVDGGYTFIPNVWDGIAAPPEGTLNRLGDLVHLSLAITELGREEVELDGETTTATVVVGSARTDYVLDPASGKVLWRASCALEGGDELPPTKVTRDGATFSYGGCKGAPAVTFTAEQAASCPS